MSSALLNLLNKARGEVAAKRGNNVDTTRLKDGDNYLRLFPNKENAEGIFYQPFGMHYVKYQNEEGKEVATAYVCDQHTHGRACQLCEMVLEGKARHKGNKAMEDKISQMRSTPRYMVNGMLSAREDFTDVEKTQLIELPATVFDDICKVMAEVQAIFGFIKNVRRYASILRSRPVILWDGWSEKRRSFYPEYKANRDDNPEMLAMKEGFAKQKPYILRMMTQLGVTQLTADDAEADDLAGMLVGKMKNAPNVDHIVATGKAELEAVAVGTALRLGIKEIGRLASLEDHQNGD